MKKSLFHTGDKNDSLVPSEILGCMALFDLFYRFHYLKSSLDRDPNFFIYIFDQRILRIKKSEEKTRYFHSGFPCLQAWDTARCAPRDGT
jgi:hypothetical protein